jgi:hypothetical protein
MSIHLLDQALICHCLVEFLTERERLNFFVLVYLGFIFLLKSLIFSKFIYGLLRYWEDSGFCGFHVQEFYMLPPPVNTPVCYCGKFGE